MIFGWLHQKLTWLALGIGALGLAFWQGVSRGAAKERVRYLEGYQRTREKMDAAELSDDVEPTAAREWLRKRMLNSGSK